MNHRCAFPVALLALSAISNSVAAQTYQLERTHVDLLFSINHAGFTQKHGSLRQLHATLQYDAQKPDKSQITVTVKTDSLDTGAPARDVTSRVTSFSTS